MSFCFKSEKEIKHLGYQVSFGDICQQLSAGMLNLGYFLMTLTSQVRRFSTFSSVVDFLSVTESLPSRFPHIHKLDYMYILRVVTLGQTFAV